MLIGKTIAIALAVVVVIGILLVGFGPILNLVQRAQPPNVQITSKNARTGMAGLDYVVWIDVSVYNSGGMGTVTVWAKVTQGSNSWTKTQSVNLGLKETKALTFTFNEFSFWSSASGAYSVWVTY